MHLNFLKMFNYSNDPVWIEDDTICEISELSCSTDFKFIVSNLRLAIGIPFCLNCIKIFQRIRNHDKSKSLQATAKILLQKPEEVHATDQRDGEEGGGVPGADGGEEEAGRKTNKGRHCSPVPERWLRYERPRLWPREKYLFLLWRIIYCSPPSHLISLLSSAERPFTLLVPALDTFIKISLSKSLLLTPTNKHCSL